MSTRAVQYQDAVESLRVLAECADNVALRGIADNDWMVSANAESARALRELAAGAPDELRHLQRTTPSIADLIAPLLAALGAADLALATVNDLLVELRERASEARRTRLTKLPEDLPGHLRELRDRFTADELRGAAEGYVEAATSQYNELVARGESALERLRSQAGFEEASAQAEGYVDQEVELTQEALDTVTAQTRAVGERAAKLVGIALPSKNASAKKARTQKAPARKAAPRKVARKK